MKPKFKVEKIGANYFEWNSIQKHRNLYVATLKINPTFANNGFIKGNPLKIYTGGSGRLILARPCYSKFRSRASSKSFPRIQISPNPKVTREFRDFS